MTVPALNQLHRPFLEVVSRTEGIVSLQHIRDALAEHFSLDQDDLLEKIPSGRNKFKERVYSSGSKLRRAGLLQSSSNGNFSITSHGRELLTEDTGVIENKQLDDLIAEAKLGQIAVELKLPDTSASDSIDGTLNEQMDELHRELNSELADELLDIMKDGSPDSFERLVVRLLEKMGYGEGEAVGRSGDGGIDGIINQDALGLEKIYIQAKRWGDQKVGAIPIQTFVGSMDIRRASKGVFITTSTFTSQALQTAQDSSVTLRLIDGPELAHLMISHGVGVVTEITYEVKKLDENYFAEI